MDGFENENRIDWERKKKVRDNGLRFQDMDDEKTMEELLLRKPKQDKKRGGKRRLIEAVDPVEVALSRRKGRRVALKYTDMLDEFYDADDV